MSVTEALLSFKGRMNRRDYWLKGVTFFAPISFLTSWLLFFPYGAAMQVLGAVLSVLLLWPSLALIVKRLHDHDRSGWYAATLLIPAANVVFGIVIFIWAGFLRGTVGTNCFGKDPFQIEPSGAGVEVADSQLAAAQPVSAPAALFRLAGLSPSLELFRIPTFFENENWRAISSWISYGFLCLCLIILLSIAGFVQAFYTLNNLKVLFMDFLPFGLMAIPMALILSNGGVDLSIGSVVGLSTVVMASILQIGGSFAAAIILTLFMALLVGFLNGVMVGVVRWPGFLVTLAMLLMLHGVSLVISSNGTLYSPKGPSQGVGSWIVGWVLLVVLVILLAVWIQYPRISAREKGRSGKATSWWVGACKIGAPYLLSSLVAGFAGILLFVRIHSGAPSLGTGYEVYILLAVALAGVYPGARYGNAVGVLFGALLFVVLQKVFNLTGVTPYYQNVFMGALFVLSLVFTFVLNTIMGNMYRARSRAAGST